MKCPKCTVYFEKVSVGDVEVDRCIGCQGIWFDEFELDLLKTVEGSEGIDVGDAGLGEEYNRMTRIACPRCGGTGHMIHMVDAAKPHIHFERCKVCHGVFLDAGEFRELKKESFTHYLTDLIKKNALQKRARGSERRL